MLVLSADRYAFPLPADHRFPADKYGALRRAVTDAGLPVQDPPGATRQQLSLAHSEAYLDRILTGTVSAMELRHIGLPWSEQLVIRARRSCGATLAAAQRALTDGIAVNLAGGTHHARRDGGAGFCLFNDAAVTIETLRDNAAIGRALIIDADVHQGDGTAAIFRGRTDVVIADLYCAANFPFQKVKATVDVPLDEGIKGPQYLEKLRDALDTSLALGPFDIAIYLAGADPHIDDMLGRMSLTTADLGMRDAHVIERVHNAQIPLVVTMAGGYPKQLRAGVQLHLQTVNIARRCHGGPQ